MTKKPEGFTFVELVIVLLVLTLMATLAAPVVTTSVQRAKEAALKENLLVIRRAIDDYYADHGYYPGELEVLVEEKYLRHVPEDPIAADGGEWVTVERDNVDTTGIVDIKSSSSEQARDGSYFGDW